jgi:hypothetical protein
MGRLERSCESQVSLSGVYTQNPGRGGTTPELSNLTQSVRPHRENQESISVFPMKMGGS